MNSPDKLGDAEMGKNKVTRMSITPPIAGGLNVEQLNQALVDYGVSEEEIRQEIIELTQDQIEDGSEYNQRFTIVISDQCPKGWYLEKKVSESVTFLAVTPVNVQVIVSKVSQ